MNHEGSVLVLYGFTVDALAVALAWIVS